MSIYTPHIIKVRRILLCPSQYARQSLVSAIAKTVHVLRRFEFEAESGGTSYTYRFNPCNDTVCGTQNGTVRKIIQRSHHSKCSSLLYTPLYLADVSVRCCPRQMVSPWESERSDVDHSQHAIIPSTSL